MLDVGMILKIAGFSFLIIIIDKVLRASGREDYAAITNIAGMVVILTMVFTLVYRLFNSVRTMFQL